MTNPKPAIEPQAKGYALHWMDGSGIQQVLADEAIVQFTGDRVYVTIGQVQVPLGLALGDKHESLDIAPVARLVFTTEAYLKVAAVMSSVANSIKKPEGNR